MNPTINTTLQVAHKRISTNKTIKQIPAPEKVCESLRPSTRDIGSKANYFDRYLSESSVLSPYQMMSHIGKGCFSTVSLAVHKDTKCKYALKTYEKIDSLEMYRLDSIRR